MDHHLLAIEDSRSRDRSVTELLRGWSYRVTTVSRDWEITRNVLAGDIDLMIINHCEPQVNALEICADLRCRNLRLPVIVLAGRDLQNRIAIFKAGADDYLLKPVDADELNVRIQALLIRSARRKKPGVTSYEFGGIQVDFRECELVRNGAPIELSQRENRLLRHFVENRGKVVSRIALLRHVWGYREAPLTRTVDVHVARLRKKIEDDPKIPQYIVTVHGFGYRFDG